jgi:hypothetical protein
MLCVFMFEKHKIGLILRLKRHIFTVKGHIFLCLCVFRNAPFVGEHSHSKARHVSQSTVETAQNVPVHFGSKVRRSVETAQNVPVHFVSKGETIQNVLVQILKSSYRHPTTSRRASKGFLAGKKSLFFGSDGTFERSVSIIKS